MENQEKKRILYVVEAFGGGVFSYLVGLTKKLAEKYEIYILFGMRDQTPADYESYFDRRVHFIQVKNFTRKIDPESLQRKSIPISFISTPPKQEQSAGLHFRGEKFRYFIRRTGTAS